MVITGIRIKPIRVPPEAYIKITAIEQANTYPSNKGLANCNTSEMNLNARDTRYINPKVLTSAVEREGVADGGTGGSGTRPSLNTGPDFPPSRGVFSLVSDAFV